jgi:hypothetical protein
MANLTRCLRQAFPGFLAVQHLLNLNPGHELYMRGVLSQAAVFHLAHQAAVRELDIHAGTGRQIARADEAQPAFRDVEHAAGSVIQPSAAHCAHLEGEVRGVARMAALFEFVHRLIIDRLSGYLYSI